MRLDFRKFMSSYRYRRKLDAAIHTQTPITPPDNPSPRYIRKLVQRLLKKHEAWNAFTELSMMGPAVVPFILEAVKDPRYHTPGEQTTLYLHSPIETTLALLLKHAPDQIVNVTLPLLKVSSMKTRQVAAMFLANVGRADTMTILRNLMLETDEPMRVAIQKGIDKAFEERRAEVAFLREAYDLLLPSCDQDWEDGWNYSPETLAKIDPAKATIDLGNERLLNLSNGNLLRHLEGCNGQKLKLPASLLCQLLQATLPRTVRRNCAPYDAIVAQTLKALAHSQADDAKTLAESLFNHKRKKIKEAAAEALTILAGVDDAADFVITREQQVGYDKLSLQQRVVYCALIFEGEVCNGGLSQFLANPSGNRVDDTLFALEQLEHPQSVDGMRKAIEVIGPQAREPDHLRRLDAFKDRWEELCPILSELDETFFNKSAQFRQILLLYTIQHAEHFRSSNARSIRS